MLKNAMIEKKSVEVAILSPSTNEMLPTGRHARLHLSNAQSGAAQGTRDARRHS
jgi:hypothetical protein